MNKTNKTRKMSMNEPTPRRSLVPGPSSNQGIAAQAIAMREQKTASTIRDNSHSPPVARLQQAAPIIPFQGVGNLAKAIASVMANIGTIEKGGYNSYHRYKYARMEDLLVALTPLMGKAGLAIFQNEIEIKTIETRVAVTYEFSIIHESGEMWPERPRFTGMSMARDSKGNWDDKAINKCHTAARKYFLLSLFQVPSGDFDDADPDPPQTQGSTQGDANQRQEKSPVPGPKDATPERDARNQATQQAAQTSQKALDDGIPHKIILGQGAGADQWASAFIKAIGKCTSQDEIKRWDAANDQALQAMSQHFSEVYDAISAAVERRISDLEAPSSSPSSVSKPGLGNGSGMPDPKPDAQEAMNWVASQLQQIKSWDGAKAFWNQYVMPHEQEFDISDWELLMQEWKRAELRLAPADDEPAPE
jgi:ERF superfamily